MSRVNLYSRVRLLTSIPKPRELADGFPQAVFEKRSAGKPTRSGASQYTST